MGAVDTVNPAFVVRLAIVLNSGLAQHAKESLQELVWGAEPVGLIAVSSGT